MSHELLQALAALNLHRNGEVFWLSYDAEATDEDLGLEDTSEAGTVELTVEDILGAELVSA